MQCPVTCARRRSSQSGRDEGRVILVRSREKRDEPSRREKATLGALARFASLWRGRAPLPLHVSDLVRQRVEQRAQLRRAVERRYECQASSVTTSMPETPNNTTGVPSACTTFPVHSTKYTRP